RVIDGVSVEPPRAPDLTLQGKRPLELDFDKRPRRGVPPGVQHRPDQKRDAEPRMEPRPINVGGHVPNVEPVTLNRQVSGFRYGEVEGSQGKQPIGQGFRPGISYSDPRPFNQQPQASRGGLM